MAESPAEETIQQQLLDILGVVDREFDGDDPWWAIAARQPKTAVAEPPPEPTADFPPVPNAESPPVPRPVRNGPEPARRAAPPQPPADSLAAESGFVPRIPETLEETGLGVSEMEALILKFLLNRAVASGRDIAAQLRLPFGLVGGLLRQAKAERLVVYKAAAPMSDYAYELTEAGFERARRYSRQCTYFGAAPVSLKDYIASVRAQSITRQKPRMSDIRRALDDLLLGPEILSQLGQAVNSGLGLFLYGAPGNGKTSIAERITRAFGRDIWIPRAISVLGEIIRLYDPSSHETLPAGDGQTQGADGVDKRWIRVRRPTIVVGGELTMDNLEVTTNTTTGISEAPLQMKANCGALVIDDFGRQRISPTELLNRWIVPLEKRYDFLNLANGRKIQIPFDQLIIFSTNLEPRDLVDEAFLRRIPYKIDVTDPTEEEFRRLFVQLAETMGIACDTGPLDYLLERHYKAASRPLRFCHPRDLLHQVRIYCDFHEIPLAITQQSIDVAVRNYFAMM